ncbi:MAG TPA: DUF3617 family protein [Anaeromyxobacteraceae bacterium]|nr:DUF3617 family protein [Anaeromyxobacteraceae bacterium]
MRKRSLWPVVVCLAVISSARAAPPSGQAAAPEPGVQWEQTSEMQMAGTPIPPQTTKFCAPKKDWKEPPKAGRDDSKCKTSDVRRDGPRMTWKFVCEGKEPVTGQGEIVVQGDGYTGKMTMHTSRGDMVTKLTGRNLGTPCDAGEAKRTVEAHQKQAEQAQAQAAAAQTRACDEAIQRMSPKVFQYTDLCKAKTADFCARMGTRSGYEALLQNPPDDQKQAAKMCGKDLDALRPRFCGEAAQALSTPGSSAEPAKKDDVHFVYAYCPDQARALAQRDCAGKSYTGLEPSMREFCVKYAQESQAQKPKPPPANPQDAAQDAAKKAVKGLFGF